MRYDRLGAHTKIDLKVHLIWEPKYRTAVLVGEVALRVHDLRRQMAREHEWGMVSGKVAGDPVHLFLSYRPNHDVSQIVPWLQGIRSRVLRQEFAHRRRKFGGRHGGARGYLAISSGTITEEMIREYSEEQEGEQIADDSRFPIDNSETHRLAVGGRLVEHDDALDEHGLKSLTASNQISLLLHELKIPKSIPSTYSGLQKFASASKSNGPNVITEVRNSIIHADTRRSKSLTFPGIPN